jgi:hypothetical protein
MTVGVTLSPSGHFQTPFIQVGNREALKSQIPAGIDARPKKSASTLSAGNTTPYDTGPPVSYSAGRVG